MGLEDLGIDVERHNSKRTTIDGETIKTVDAAIGKMEEMKDILGHYPTQHEWDQNRNKINVSTSGGSFSAVIGVPFNEVKTRAGADPSQINRQGKEIKHTEWMERDTPEKAYVIGVLLGDAFLSNRSNKNNQIGIETKDKEFAEEFGKQLCRLLSIKWRGWDDPQTEVSCRCRGKRAENREPIWSLDRGIVNVYDWFKRYEDERHTEWIDEIEMNKKYLVRGLWDSEGHIERRGKAVGFTSTDDDTKQLFVESVNDVLDLEDKLNGMVSDETTIASLNGKRVTIMNKYREEFFIKINPTIHRKRERFKEMILQ